MKQTKHIPDIPPLQVRITETKALYRNGRLVQAKGKIHSYTPILQ